VDDAHLTVSLITLGDPGRVTGGYLYHRRMAELAPAHGATVGFVSFPERPFPLPAVAGPLVLRRAVRPSIRHGAPALSSRRLDVVVLDSIAAAFLGPWLAARRAVPPVVGSLHQPPGGIDHGPVRRAVQAPLDRQAWRRARLLLVASQALAEHMTTEGFPRERIRVVPPGRDVAPAPTGPPPELRVGRRAGLLCVANWVERKGILSLLEATAQLPERLATLHLAGDDRADPRYAAMVRARLSRPDLAGRVVVHGPLPREQVAALYQAADLFVLPSFREPYGTVWGEAMAFGLPVVGWRAGNLPHLAEHGREGLLVRPGDVDGLSGALGHLAGDEALCRRMGEAARRRAAGRPTWEQSAAMFFAALREAAHDRGPV
jgi:glycosyltransferase involved in cell wall biosynthesis